MILQSRKLVSFDIEECLKESADYVTMDVNEDGILSAFQKLKII